MHTTWVCQCVCVCTICELIVLQLHSEEIKKRISTKYHEITTKQFFLIVQYQIFNAVFLFHFPVWVWITVQIFIFCLKFGPTGVTVTVNWFIQPDMTSSFVPLSFSLRSKVLSVHQGLCFFFSRNCGILAVQIIWYLYEWSGFYWITGDREAKEDKQASERQRKGERTREITWQKRERESFRWLRLKLQI